MSEIEVTVSKDGAVTVEVRGVNGPGCLELSRAIEEALGTVEARSCTLEYYEQAETSEQLVQRDS